MPQPYPRPPTIRERIDALWDRKASAKLDWLELEKLLHDILQASHSRTSIDNKHSPSHYLRIIDEALAAFTRRGSVYPQDDRI